MKFARLFRAFSARSLLASHPQTHIGGRPSRCPVRWAPGSRQWILRPTWTVRLLPDGKRVDFSFLPRCHPGLDERGQALVQVCRPSLACRQSRVQHSGQPAPTRRSHGTGFHTLLVAGSRCDRLRSRSVTLTRLFSPALAPGATQDKQSAVPDLVGWPPFRGWPLPLLTR